jgi:hypothetical protein
MAPFLCPIMAVPLQIGDGIFGLSDCPESAAN